MTEEGIAWEETFAIKANECRKQKRRKRIKDTENYKEHLKFLASLDQFPSGAYLKTSRGGWQNEVGEDHWYYKRFYRGKASGWLKKIAGKKVRRKEGEIKKGGSYKKIFDFWWELY